MFRTNYFRGYYAPDGFDYTSAFEINVVVLVSQAYVPVSGTHIIMSLINFTNL